MKQDFKSLKLLLPFKNWILESWFSLALISSSDKAREDQIRELRLIPVFHTNEKNTTEDEKNWRENFLQPECNAVRIHLVLKERAQFLLARCVK